MKKVGIIFKKNVEYPKGKELVYPNEKYAELNIEHDRYNKHNDVFSMLRDCFIILKLDEKNIGTKKWNPLGKIIKPGNQVLLKPNLVLDENKSGDGTDCLYTNPSVVSAIINYVWKALNGNGKIIVADAPVQQCDFDNLIKKSGYEYLVDYYQKKGVNIELKDLRGLVAKKENNVLVQKLVEDNGIIVDLSINSEHANIGDYKKNRITNYNPNELLSHHNLLKHEYLISKDILESDVIINIPKPKAHRKAGVTIGLKNFIGANVRKEYLPHHRTGSIDEGGDEYLKKSFLLKNSSKLIDKFNIYKSQGKYKKARILNKIARIMAAVDKRFVSKETNREGSWYGNDTIWRTIIDVNKIVKYSNNIGKMCDKPQRKIFTIADMIYIGEKEGPLLPSSKYAGMIAMSDDLVCFDEAICTILGFDINKIPLYQHIREKRKYPLVLEEEPIIVSNKESINNKTIKDIPKKNTLSIEPSSGWKNHIELER